MNHLWHHLSWLLRRYARSLLGYTVAWILLSVLVWIMPNDPGINAGLNVAHRLLMLWGCGILTAALWQDQALGSDTFWRTRPVRWKALCGSQCCFLLVFLAGPPVCSWLLNGLMLDQTVSQWCWGLWDLTSILCPLLAVAGVASFARNWSSFLFVLVATGLLSLTGNFIATKYLELPKHGALSAGETQVVTVVTLVLPSVAGAGAWLAGMKRGRWPRRAYWLAFLLLLGPSALSESLSQVKAKSAPNPQHLQKFSYSPWKLHSAPQLRNIFELEDVPEGLTPIFDDGNVAVRTLDLDCIPEDSLRRSLPLNARWYSTPPPRASILLVEHKPRFKKEVGGSLLSSLLLASAPLEQGICVTHQGMRLQLNEFSYTADTISLRAQFWSAGSLGFPVLPAQGISDGTGSVRLLPVFYFPSLSLAILDRVALEQGPFETVRSWQMLSGNLQRSFSLPSAEAIQGVRLNAENMKHAQLLLFGVHVEGRFLAHPSPQPPPSACDALIAEVLHAKVDVSLELNERLQRLGKPAVDALLRYPWPLHHFPRFAGSMLAQAEPELLAQAVWQDDRWMEMALQHGLAAQLQESVRARLRETEIPLSPSALTIAASAATPADYPALQHWAAFVKPPAGAATEGTPESLLWNRLRLLPDFDLQAIAK